MVFGRARAPGADAEQLEVSRGLVHEWLNGRRSPDVDQFFTLKAFLRKQRRRA